MFATCLETCKMSLAHVRSYDAQTVCGTLYIPSMKLGPDIVKHFSTTESCMYELDVYSNNNSKIFIDTMHCEKIARDVWESNILSSVIYLTGVSST